MNRAQLCPMIQAILAAVLFGASTPLTKLLLGKIEPVPLSGFIYLGSGLGLILYIVIQRLFHGPSREGRLTRSDLPWLLGVILAGGVAGPIVLMYSLRVTPPATASLLLNFEGTATTLIAFFVFKEAVGKRVWWSVLLITLASIILSWNTGGEWGISLGAVGILSACFLWGLDNNLTKKISSKDPLAIVAVKGTSAGTISLFLAFLLNSPFPGIKIILLTMAMGIVCYGTSIVLFILAMRTIGTVKTVALYSTAPFAGAIISFLFFREMPGLLFFASLPIMLIGAVLIFNDEQRFKYIRV